MCGHPGFNPDRYKDREYAQKLRAIVGYGVECGRDEKSRKTTDINSGTFRTRGSKKT